MSLYNVQGRMTTLHPYSIFRVECLHYVPIKHSGCNDYSTSQYNVQGRMTTLNPYSMFRVELLLYIAIQCSG